MTDNNESAVESETTDTTNVTPETSTVIAPTDNVLESAPDRDERRDERTRAKLRQTERDRDRFREALVPHVRGAVETVARTRLSDPAALWLLPDLDPLSLLADDMSVDPAKVASAVETLHERLPSTAKRFGGGADGGARISSRIKETSWGEALQSP